MKSCELCKSSSAKMYCESDQASLCWDCDVKVHSANFLVARHSRSLLCHVCQSPTSWNASGAKLGRTVSVCESCVDDWGRVNEENGYRNGDESYNGEIDGEDEEYDEEDEIGGYDEDGDNQVVPWSSTPPHPDVSSPSSQESSSGFRNDDRAVSLKQLGGNIADLCSDNDGRRCSSAHRENSSPLAPRYNKTAVVESLMPLKRKRTETTGTSCAVIVETIVEIYNPRKNRKPSALNRRECHSRLI